MDDYRDVETGYRLSLEKIILDAGLKLPSIWGNLSKEEQKQTQRRVSKIREAQ